MKVSVANAASHEESQAFVDDLRDELFRFACDNRASAQSLPRFAEIEKRGLENRWNNEASP
jgi:hypothetical protein